MKNTNCYMPAWNMGKLVKKGSYCNWESVLAHAKHMHGVLRVLEDSEYDAIKDYVQIQMGDTIHHADAPHFKELEHLHFGLVHDTCKNAVEYHKACCHQGDEIVAVKLNEAGHTFEVLVDSFGGRYDFARMLKAPANWDLSPSTFQALRKGKHKIKELCVYYHPSHCGNGNGLEFNAYASNIFKMQIYGEVILVQRTKELSFLPRERFVNYTLAEFNDDFARKRKRTEKASVSLCPEQYTTLKAEMQDSLCAYEAQAASLSEVPGLSAKAAKCPPMSGRDLAVLKKHQLQEEARQLELEKARLLEAAA